MTTISCGLCCEGNDLFVFCDVHQYKTQIYKTFKSPISELFLAVKEMKIVDKLQLIHINAELDIQEFQLLIHNAYLNDERANDELVEHMQSLLKI